MAAHRYWRVSGLNNPHGQQNIISRLDLIDTVGNSTLTGFGTAFASSEYSVSYPANNAFNGTPFTTDPWDSDATEAVSYLGYDFGISNAFDIILVVITAWQHSPDYTTLSFSLDYSDDNVSWISAQSFTTGPWRSALSQAFVVGSPLLPIAWDRYSQVYSSFTMNSSGLTVTHNRATGSWLVGRTYYGYSSGKYYLETTIDALMSDYLIIGVTNISQAIDQYIGSNAYTGLAYDSRNFIYPGVISGPGSSSVTDIICIAYDFTNKLIWFRINNGQWNAGGSDDPSTGVGGYSFSSVTGDCYPSFCTKTAGVTTTTNFGSSAYTFTKPTGFSNFSPPSPTAALVIDKLSQYVVITPLDQLDVYKAVNYVILNDSGEFVRKFVQYAIINESNSNIITLSNTFNFIIT